MPRNPTTGAFTRVSNSFSDPVSGTVIDPIDATAYYSDIDTGLSLPILGDQNANKVYAGPASGADTNPTFRALVGADLPNPSSTTLGGVQSKAAVTSEWINSISTSGVPSSAQPAFTDISGTATATQGGTGQTTYAVGDLLYASTTSALSKLADVATGNVVISGGVGGAPSYGKVGLTTHVSGILPVANGGTNASSASGTALDNITGFASTGFLTRTGAGTYAFQSTTNGITNANLATAGAATLKGNPTASTGNVSDFTIQGLTARGTPDAANDKILIFDNAAGTLKYVTPAQVAAGGTGSFRTALTGNTTYYVRTDGSDSNTGLVNNAGGAFLTIQKAFDVLGLLDILNYSVTIQVAAGTYTGNILITQGWVGTGTVQLLGDTTTPSNVFINAVTPFYILDCPVTVSIGGFKLQASSGNLLASQGAGSYIIVNGKMDYGSTPAAQEYASRLGRIRVSAAIDLSGNADSFAVSSHGGNIRHDAGETKLLANRAYSSITGFAYADYGDIVWTGTATINLNGFTATGQRFGVFNRGMIQCNGLFPPAPTFFPGSSAGPFLGPDVFSQVIRPSALGASQNNWNPVDASTALPFYQSGGIYMSASTPVDITGIAATNVNEGQTLTINNIGAANNITLKNLSGSSSAGNQFVIVSDIIIAPGAATRIRYDKTNGFWRSG